MIFFIVKLYYSYFPPQIYNINIFKFALQEVPAAKSAALAIVMISGMKSSHLKEQFAVCLNSGSNIKDQIPSCTRW